MSESNKHMKKKAVKQPINKTTGKKVITKTKQSPVTQGKIERQIDKKTVKAKSAASTVSPEKKSTRIEKKHSKKSFFVQLKEEFFDLWNPIKNELLKISSEEWYKIGYIAFSCYLILLGLGYIRAITWLKSTVITNNLLIILICATAPFFLWAFSTKYDRWSFHNIKKIWLYLVISGAIATIEQPIIYLSWRFLVTKVMEIPVTENMTAGMVVSLARFSMVIPLIIVTVILAIPIKQFITSTEIQDKIEDFKITNHVDMRKNKNSLYDLHIIKNLKTGKDEVIMEADRFVHMFINGQSGTGKTSSTIIPAVCEDLNTKIRNMIGREAALLEMLKEKKAYIAGPFAKVNESNIKPRKGYEEVYKNIYKRYPDCGMLIMAPNNDMNNTIVALCDAKGIKVNYIDPSKKYKEKFAIAKGIANFYIPPNLSEEERCIRIVEQAETFSEVLIATNESKGEGDQYFRDINTSVTTNIAIACMLAASIEGTQTDIIEINNCISSFNELKSKIQTIEDHYDIKVEVIYPDGKKGKMDEEVTKEAISEALLKKGKSTFGKGKGTDNPYYTTILFIKQELLGPGAEKMIDQSRGLRNLINKILLDSRYKAILSVPKDRALDFDEILAKSEVTVVNTAIEYGAPKSTALGIMTLLNLQTAVLRRPQDTRSNFFIWVDEASQYMHPVYDNMYALYRQYRASTCLAMQSTSQMDKSKNTAYLKSIILGAGTQILFGRASAEEMKMYQELAGEIFEDTVQKTVSQTSLFSTSVNQNESQRVVTEKKNIITGTKIRNRNFQEVTVFKIKNNKVQSAFLGKCSFLDKNELKLNRVKHIDFSKFVPKGKVKKEVVLTKPAQKMVIQQSDTINQYKENISILHMDRDKQLASTPIEETLELSVPLENTMNKKELQNKLKENLEKRVKEHLEEDISIDKNENTVYEQTSLEREIEDAESLLQQEEKEFNFGNLFMEEEKETDEEYFLNDRYLEKEMKNLMKKAKGEE